ncbi:cryptochrome/photolyase family protein [Rhodobiaceae bacterium]|nr:cryptochrome/photolyase family protein [Rhodobiaceae bacterium]
MTEKSLLLILGNQLFPIDNIKSLNPDIVFMAEDLGLSTYEKHHKLKILMIFSAMREKRDELINNNIDVDYTEIEDPDFNLTFEDKLEKCIKKNNIKNVNIFEIEDKSFEKRIIVFSKKNNLSLTISPSPMFLIKRDEFLELKGSSKVIRMGNFYKNVRKKLNILVDEDQKPIGGKWSFDDENRKKIPKGLDIPGLLEIEISKYAEELKPIIDKKFNNHPGKMDDIWVPFNRAEALKNLDYFISTKFENFGPYEDAILSNNSFLFHSALSPSMNIGLITPQDVVDRILDYANEKEVPINSLEGFIRQIIGWREFIRGVYQNYGDEQLESNFFNFSRLLKDTWYSGSTGIPPLDDAIKLSDKYGYTHHINRLMVISNLMTLTEIDPKNIYKWFMEMYVDSSEWVMVPNVFGMGTFADGGIFSTKPYVCGSNYLLKMSNYKKGEWCHTVDGLYWRFFEKNMTKLQNNPRLSFMRKTFENMDLERKKMIFSHAELFIEKHSYSK